MEYFDLSRVTNDELCGEGTLGAEQTYYIVQGNDYLEVNSETHLDDCANSSGDDHMDVDALNEELSIFCENLLEKYKLLKKRSFALKEENKNLSSKLDVAL